MRNIQEVKRNRHCRSKRHRKEGIHEHGVLRAAIAFGSGTEDECAHIEQKRNAVPRKFLGNVGRKGAYKNHERAEKRNQGRHPERIHDAVIGRAVVQLVLRKVPIQALIESKRCRVGNGQKKRLRRDKDSKFGGTKYTRHQKSQKRAANLEDCPHNVDNHSLL